MARKMTQDYAESDVEAVWRRGDWHNYQDVVKWLETEGNDDNELTPGEVQAMDQDIKRLMNDGKPFSSDPDQVYSWAHKGRSSQGKMK
jgi:hypothetical protein